MKPYERDIKFVNNVLITLLDEQMRKIKILDLDELYILKMLAETDKKITFLAEIIYSLKMLFEVAIL